MSQRIRRTHSPVIGFRGKVFRLTLGKGGFLLWLIESVVGVKEHGRDVPPTALRGSAAKKFLLHFVRSLKTCPASTLFCED